MVTATRTVAEWKHFVVKRHKPFKMHDRAFEMPYKALLVKGFATNLRRLLMFVQGLRRAFKSFTRDLMSLQGLSHVL